MTFIKAPISSGASFARFVELLTDGSKEERGKGTESRGAREDKISVAVDQERHLHISS